MVRSPALTRQPSIVAFASKPPASAARSAAVCSSAAGHVRPGGLGAGRA